MEQHTQSQTDYGTGEKKLSIYIIGTISCLGLTLLSFWAVMSGSFDKSVTFLVIYSSAIMQFVVQLICFLRLNTQTERGQMNVAALVFTLVILVTIIIGSLWIMSNTGYNMMH